MATASARIKAVTKLRSSYTTRASSKITSEACRKPDVGRRREVQQALFVAVWDVKGTDERVQRLSRNAVLASRERFELLVGLLATVTPHHGLNRLGQHL